MTQCKKIIKMTGKRCKRGATICGYCIQHSEGFIKKRNKLEWGTTIKEKMKFYKDKMGISKEEVLDYYANKRWIFQLLKEEFGSECNCKVVGFYPTFNGYSAQTLPCPRCILINKIINYLSNESEKVSNQEIDRLNKKDKEERMERRLNKR